MRASAARRSSVKSPLSLPKERISTTPVFPNNSTAPWAKLSAEAAAEIASAHVLLAKGQGNYETLMGCGLNVYYMFLCKCDMFANLFAVPRFTGMLLNDRKDFKL